MRISLSLWVFLLSCSLSTCAIHHHFYFGFTVLDTDSCEHKCEATSKRCEAKHARLQKGCKKIGHELELRCKQNNCNDSDCKLCLDMRVQKTFDCWKEHDTERRDCRAQLAKCKKECS